MGGKKVLKSIEIRKTDSCNSIIFFFNAAIARGSMRDLNYEAFKFSCALSRCSSAYR